MGDFGISKVFLNKETLEAELPGTCPYMAPEVWGGSLMPASDIWALGCVIHEFCSLEVTFKSDRKVPIDFKQIVQKQKHEKIPNLYSPELSSLIDTMLDKAPEKRPTAS
jgi:NIMA (never in mitosis gene a)-related kinase